MNLYKRAWISVRDLAEHWGFDKRTVEKIIKIEKFKTIKGSEKNSPLRIRVSDVVFFEKQ